MDNNNGYNSKILLQLFVIRVYIGLDFIHHFAEKFGYLGYDAFINVSNYFSSIGFGSHMVFLAGIFELIGFIGFTFGLFTRFTAITMCVYLLAALFSGNHQHFGFTWANPGGGWEFPLFWAFMCLSFVLTGGGKWSMDSILKPKLPGKLKFLCI